MDVGCRVLPAAPNWYCSRVSQCSTAGIFLYGAKNNVFVFDVAIKPVRYVGRFVCHRERVVGVSVRSAGLEEKRVVTAGEDGRVRLWDYTGLIDGHGGEVIMLDEHANHKNKPTVVHWSPKDEDVIVSGDEKGSIIVWHASRSDVRQMLPEKSGVVCLECSPHSRYHVAVGYRSGLVLVLDISGQGAALQRLRGHDDEIHTVTWCPQLGEDVRQRAGEGEEEEEEEGGPGYNTGTSFATGCLLASGSRDRTLRVWSSTRGRCLLNFKVSASSGRREKYEEQKVRVWLAVRWMAGRHRHLVTSTHSGDLLLWDLCRPGKQKYEVLAPRGPVKGHNRIVFNISSPEGTRHNNTLVTISMDRQIIVWDLESTTLEAIQSLGGFAYCLAQSPLNPASLAIGVGDNMIRVWNTENLNNRYDCASYWQGIKSKVTSLSWHPEKEGRLAFGTDDGRVGVYDVTSHGRAPKISCTFHKRTVYVVAWGPPCRPNSDVAYVVYSCGDGNILVHDFSQPQEDAIDLNTVLPQKQGRGRQRSEISWKPDYSSVALGNEDGSVDIYAAPSLVHMATLQVHRKLVNVIRWHPVYTEQSVNPSPCQHWLATGSNEPVIHVFNLEALLESPPPNNAPLVTESFISLSGHSNRITGLAWSNHDNAVLASACYDGTAQVWQLLPTSEGVANFRGHSGRLLSVAWDPADPDTLFSGGDDFCVLSWKVSQQAHKLPPQVAERKKKSKSKNRSKPVTTETVASSGDVMGKSSDITTMGEIQAMLDAKRCQLMSQEKELVKDLLPGNEDTSKNALGEEASSQNLTTEDVNEPAPLKRELREPKKRRIKSLFPVFSNAENRRKGDLQEECIILATNLTKKASDGCYGDGLRHLGIYSSRRDVYRLVEEEASNHKNQGNSEQLLYLDIWSGDLSLTLGRAAEKGQLNDLLMAHACSASPLLWRSLCETYASQLESDGYMVKAASYLVSAGHVYKAVDLFIRHNMFKEAVSLARLRLSLGDPLIEKLYSHWAEHLTSEGSYEQAAKCYLAVGHYLDAAKCLARRYELTALKAAIDITSLANENEALMAYGYKYLQECQLAGDWLAGFQLIKEHPAFKVKHLPLIAHEMLVTQLSLLRLDSGYDLTAMTSAIPKTKPDDSLNTSSLPRLLLDPADRNALCPWEPQLVDGESPVLYLLRLWLDHAQLDLHPDPLRALYQELSEQRSTHQGHNQNKQILLDISLDVTLGVICLLLANTKMAAYWWVRAMVTCQLTNHSQLLQGLCQILLPQGRTSLALLQQQVLAVKTVMLGDVTGSGYAHHSSNPAHLHTMATPSITVTDSTQSASVNNSSVKCSSIDCLHAFYLLSVTDFWIEAQSEKSSPVTSELSSATHTELSDCPDAPGTVTQEPNASASVTTVLNNIDIELSTVGTVIPVMTDSTVSAENSTKGTGSDIGGRGDSVKEKNLVRAPGSEELEGLCQGLLWDVQAKRSRLRAMLKEIERVAAETKPKHNKDVTLHCDREDERNASIDLLACGDINIERTLSGEYLHMASYKGSTVCRKFPRSPHHSEDESMMIDAEVADAVSTSDQGLAESTRGLPMIAENEKMESGVAGDVSSNLLVLPPWSRGLLEGRYTSDTSQETLIHDRDLVKDELIRLSVHVTSTPFMDPMVSAEKLLQLLRIVPCGAPLVDLVIKWGQKHAYNIEQKQKFNLLQ